MVDLPIVDHFIDITEYIFFSPVERKQKHLQMSSTEEAFVYMKIVITEL